MTCSNSTGSTKFRKATFSVYNSGTSYGTCAAAGNIANGDTIEQPCSAQHIFTGVPGGAAITFSARQANHGSSTIDQSIENVVLRVEVIYR
jgi:hypothetical protein